MKITELSSSAKETLLAQKESVYSAYEELKGRGLNLDLTRGKPSTEQLDFATELLSLPGSNFRTASGVDARNYGIASGITEARALWAEVLGVDVETTWAGDSSSLNIEFDLISWSYTFGNNDSVAPWSQEQARHAAQGERLKWICPVPGYDRHHSITELFGFEMLTVDMTPEGPNMDQVRELVKDPTVKGMWTVPMFSNPTGVTFTEDVARQLAAMDTAAPDFRIVWDNAYAVHTLTEEFPPILNIIQIAAEEGNPNRFWALSSTSKITLAGSGVAFLTTSPENLAWYGSIAGVRGIGPNKINQLAHVQYFGDAEGVREVMRKHAASLAPKFETVIQILDSRLGGLGIAEWTRPTGGYFISLDLIDGTAQRVVELAKEAGIALTAAGSTFPYLRDPRDYNLRLAPSMPEVEQLALAMDGVATCVLLATLEALEAAEASSSSSDQDA